MRRGKEEVGQAYKEPDAHTSEKGNVPRGGGGDRRCRRSGGRSKDRRTIRTERNRNFRLVQKEHAGEGPGGKKEGVLLLRKPKLRLARGVLHRSF